MDATRTTRPPSPIGFLGRVPSRESRDTLFMVALIGWTILPHVGHLPVGVSVLVAGVLAWRAGLAWRQRPLPGRVAVGGLLALAAAITWWSDRTLLGKEAGVTLLVMLMALKTLELRARRDALVVFFLGFFLVLTHFLYSQSLFTAAAMFVSVWGWLTALTLAHMPAGRPPLAQAARLAGRAALVGMPLMLLLFLLFPRIGPLWALPSDANRTGLSDRLELGNVAELANDDSIAMRVRFAGRVPPNEQLYFRGPVLVDTDGRTWRAASADGLGRAPGGPVSISGAPARYEVTLEPTQLTWLPLLEQALPTSLDGAPGVTVVAGGDGVSIVPEPSGEWRTRVPLAHTLRLRVISWPHAHLDAGLPPADIGRDLRLPASAAPRMRAWAERLRAQAGGAEADPDDLVARLYQHIRTQPFTYTLTPGTYDNDPVDEFWFGRRTGFCEHFATAFVVALRSMGVPARVVTGYQGTDATAQDGDLVVRQSYAHAWAEYWVPTRGWTRADPTAAVAPDRIARGRALQAPPGLMGSALSAVSPNLRQDLRQLWETLDHRWNEWVLGYDRTTQFDLMKHLGIDTPGSEDLGRALIVAMVGVSLVGVGMAWWDAHRRTPGQRLWRRLAGSLQPLAPLGLEVPAHASPGIVARALRARWGASAQALAAHLDALERARYGPATVQPPTEGPPRRARTDAAAWRAVRDEARALAAALRRVDKLGR